MLRDLIIGSILLSDQSSILLVHCSSRIVGEKIKKDALSFKNFSLSYEWYQPPTSTEGDVDEGGAAAGALDVEASEDVLGMARCRSVNQPEVQEVAEQVRQV